MISQQHLEHLVRVGVMGLLGRFRSSDGTVYPRGVKVIVRTRRGLEVGEVLAPVPLGEHPGAEAGQILRGMTGQDELLLERLEKNRCEAFDACNDLLTQRGLSAVLLDVEQLFDGQGIFFYFLGEVEPAVEALSAELASVYDTQARMQQFADTLLEGCGPGCGTDAAEGGACDNCGSCALAAACGSSRK